MEMEIKFEIIEATNGFIVHYGEMYMVAKGTNSEESRMELRNTWRTSSPRKCPTSMRVRTELKLRGYD